ncbi:dTMP kinase [Paragonimus westermani]|uniref:dTMP kinase n=1 Tax=Paragonimus westermani TaxID=34504 RepID=A0A5J4NVN4_9TREM|nr:dTMP kinase [Paragonimus westermani]
MKRGLFIVFEGTEKGGKKTQAKLLADALTQITGKETLFIHFPDRSTPVGQLITRYHSGDLKLNPRVAHLLYTANRWERQKDISTALKSGINVVADRYSYSGIVNTAAKIQPLSNADWLWCRSTESGLLPPDLILCLAGENMSEIAAREGFGHKPSETTSFQAKVLCNYARLSREMEDELNEGGDKDGDQAINNGTRKPKLWNWIQATDQTVDDVHTCIMAIVDPLL